MNKDFGSFIKKYNKLKEEAKEHGYKLILKEKVPGIKVKKCPICGKRPSHQIMYDAKYVMNSQIHRGYVYGCEKCGIAAWNVFPDTQEWMIYLAKSNWNDLVDMKARELESQD